MNQFTTNPNAAHEIVASHDISPDEKSFLLTELAKKITNINQEHTKNKVTPLELATLQPNHDPVIKVIIRSGGRPNKSAFCNAYVAGFIENVNALLENYPKNKDPFTPIELFTYALSIIDSNVVANLIPHQKNNANKILRLLIELGYNIDDVIPNIGISVSTYIESNKQQWPDLFDIIKKKKS